MSRPSTSLVVLAMALTSHAARPVPEAAAPNSPRLAVILVVDGLSWATLRAARPWFTSGLKRLLDEGAVATECRYDHLNTETGPGHASVATGAPPRVHGIALNRWYEPSSDGKTMQAIYSASQPVAGEPESSLKTIPGPGRLRVATLGDRLVARDPRATVVAISNKDRGAILLAGRDPRAAAYWYSSKDGTYVTSAAYDAASPTGAEVAQVIAGFNRDEAGAGLAAHAGTVWSRLPVPEPSPAGGYESGLEAYQDPVVGPSFPHDLAKAQQPLASAVLSTPMADAMLTNLALRLVDDDALGLGRHDRADLLAVSFSSNDYVSHAYGPESVEALEILRSLDLDIGRLLDELTSRFGKGRVLVALTADHGFLPLPEATSRRDPRAPGGRVDSVKLVEALNAAVDAALSRAEGPPLIHKLETCSLYLDRTAFGSPGAPSVGRVVSVVRAQLAKTWKDTIEATFPVDSARPRRGELARRAWNARVPGRSGDLLVVPRYGELVGVYGGKGSGHGTPWEYDTHVPLVFWGGGARPSERSTPVTPYDLAPTLGSWLGVSLPDATGRRIDIWSPGPKACAP